MRLIRALSAAFVIFAATAVFAQLTGFTGDTLGPDVSQYQGKALKWEQGSHDYFVMHRSMVANNNPDNDNGGQNPQADSCMASNFFTVDGSHMPPDALVENAFLVWISNNPSANLGAPTDNQVQLDFTAADGSFTVSRTVTASRVGYLGEEGNVGQQDFEFEGMKFARAGGAFDCGYYTYRVGIDDFFAEIHQKGRDAGYGLDGLSLNGTYTLSQMACFNDEIYWSGGAMIIGGWAIVVIYKSEEITPKMIYMYNGFKMYMDEEAPIPVTGFELPDTPAVRVSLLVNEGDPNMADFTYYSHAESLMLKGQTAPDVLYIFNDCNPPMSLNGANYTEMYNSISSFYGWNDTTPLCIGGIPPNLDLNTIQYAMDFDTFIFSAENPPFDQHLKRGDTSLELRVSANADVVVTNLMVVSVTTRASKYDIPVNPNTPNGREKHFCSCSPVEDSVCFDRPYYYTLKVQNWGDELGENITLQDDLPSQVDYVAGSTEIARAFDASGNGTDWTAIPDGAGGAFPFATPYKVADVLTYCNTVTNECPDTLLIRFKVMPKNGLPKNTVIENTAVINDTTNLPYRTNTTVPLRLRSGNCPSPAECPEPTKAECGGEAQNATECQNDEECGDGKKCDNGNCVVDTGSFASNTAVEFALGKNSPANGSSIYVPAPSSGLIVGQFTLKAISPGNSGKVFSFDDVKVKFTLSTPQIQLGGLTLVRDLNGNGVRDPEDTVLATAAGLSAGYADFVIPINSRAFPVNTLHYFLVVVDAAFSGPTIPANASFKGEIENSVSLIVSDAGTPTVKENTVPFASFAFDPSQGAFIFTKGPNDPSVRAPADMKSAMPLLQIRAVSPGQANTIERITVKTATGSVRYGEGIAKLTLWADTDGNGTGDAPITSMPAYEPGDSSVEFVLPGGLALAAGETKYLVLNGELSLSGTEKAILEVPKSGVDLGTTATIVELPVRSREFTVVCDVTDVTCNGTNGGDDEVTEEDTACGCSVVGDTASGPYGAALILMAALLLAIRRLFTA